MKRIGEKVLYALAIMLCVAASFSTGFARQDKNPKKLIGDMQEATGNWDKLYSMNDVEFTYKYHYPGPNIMDLSTERYVFEGEKSWAKYSVHQINVAPKEEGEVVQYYDGKAASMSQNGKAMSSPEAVGSTEFLRKANYFWFVMNFKLMDPGTVHKYEGQETVNGINYDKVSIAYESTVTGKPQNDAYIVYINPETKMIDRFFFSLTVMGVDKPMILMEVAYEDYDGLKLPTKRTIYMPGADGKLATSPSLIQTSTGLKFNNNFSAEDLKI